MKKLALLIISISSLVFCVSSCSSSSSQERKRAEAAKIIQNKDCGDLLNDLYLAADGDEQSLARILNVTPSVINRVRNGETKPSIEFEDRIREVSVFYYVNAKNFYRLRSDLDPKWKPIIDTIGHLPKYNPVLFWFILLLLVGGIVFCLKVWFYQSWKLFALAVAIYLFIWLLSVLFAPRAMNDPYVDTINPVVEQVIL
jgi:transcriptional regulator with XRE-family HTH domain